MKKIRFLAAMLCAALAMGLLCFAACKPKEPETPTATLTLSAGEGGTLDATSYEVAVGASLAEFLSSVTPTPETGLTFAGWYSGNDPVGAQTMPEGGLTLTAKYYATYTAELYFEDVNGEYGAATEKTGTAIFGEAFTYTPQEEHFLPDESKENVLSVQELGKAERFTVYLKRETMNVFYYANAPEGAEIEGSLLPTSVRYGAEVELSGIGDLQVPAWYRFAGWATEADGEIEYSAGERLELSETLFLYAIWDEAYYDRFGGGDFLFFPQTEPGVALLRRANEEYRGEATSGAEPDTLQFTIRNDGKEVLKGKANETSGTFVYYREAQANRSYPQANAYTEELYENGASITFDGFGGARYLEGGLEMEGDISYDPETMFYTFRSGETSFSFMITEMAFGEERQTVFLRPGAERGSYAQFVFYYAEDAVQAYSPLIYVLDGFGMAIGADPETYDVYYIGSYLPGEDGVWEFTLVDSDDGISEMTGKLLSYDEMPIILFEDGLKGSYTGTDGQTLTLDGFSGSEDSAVFNEGGTEKKGMYVPESSPLGIILRFVENGGDVVTYRLDSAGKTFSLLGDGTYTEYHYYYGLSDATGIGSTTIVLGEDDSAVYYYEMEGVEGTVSKVAGKDGFFLYTSDDGELIFEFELGSGYFPYGLYTFYFSYFIQYPTVETKGAKKIESDDGGVLLLSPLNSEGQAAGNSLYTADGVSHLGAVSLFMGESSPLGFDFMEFLDIQTGEFFYFTFTGTGDEMKFTLIEGESGFYSLYDGAIEEDYSLFLLADDTHSALYFDPDHEGGILGTYTYDGETGEGVFTPAGSGETFRFLLLVLDGDNTLCYARHNDLWTGSKTFTGENSSLTLDGYGFADLDGLEMQYYIVGALSAENAYRIYAYALSEEGVWEGLFDIDLKNGTFTRCGYEAGQYLADDNSGDVLLLDGYGKVTRHNIACREEDDTLTVLETGTYTFVDTENEILLVVFKEKSYRIHIWGSYDGEETTAYYTAEYEGAGTYISGDLEYLSLDPYGTAVFTDRYGVSYEGEYTRLSARAVSFASETLDGEQIFVLGENGAFTHPIEGFVIDGNVLVKYLGGEGAEMKIPAGVTEIAPLAFSVHEYGSRYRGADILSLDLSDVETIGANAFNGCGLLKTVRGDKVKTVGANAFYACIELTGVNLPAAETIGENAFRLAESLINLSLPKAKVLYSSAFSGCYFLEKVDLPAIEELYEGVFFDCFFLQSVTLGESLTQLGTPEEPVAGVFGRSYGTEQAPVKVILQGKTVPTVGQNLFEGVNTYTVCVPDIATVKTFYLDKTWAAYNGNLGARSSYDGTYYNYSYGTRTFVLDGVLREVYYRVTVLGAYEVRGEKLFTLKFDPQSDTGYTEKEMFGFTSENEFWYDQYGYQDEEYYSYYHKAGKELTFKVNGTDADTIVFTPDEYRTFAAGVAYEVPAVWTHKGERVEAAVQLSFDSDFSPIMNLLTEGYRYSMSPSAGNADFSVSLGSPQFDPIITFYTADDRSQLTISQNDEEGTNYTASFRIASITDEDGNPFEIVNAPVTRNEDTFTAVQSYVFAGYSYRMTFTLTGEDSFSYAYEREQQIVIETEDGSAKVVLYRSEEGQITSVTLFVSGKEFGEDAQNCLFNHTDGSNVYYWLVYDYNYAGEFTLTLTEEGSALGGELSSSTVVKGYLDGVYAIAFYTNSARTALWMRTSSGGYGEVESGEIQEENGYLRVTFQGNVYYVTLDLASKTATIVFADKTYSFDEDEEMQGDLRVVRDPDGSLRQMTLTVNGKKYEDYTEYQGEYSSYYIFTDGTHYYEVQINTSDCTVSALTQRKYTCGEFSVTLLIRPNGEAAGIVSPKYAGKKVDASFKADYKWGADYALIEIETDEGSKTYFIADTLKEDMEELLEKTLETDDGQYRVTVLVTGNGRVFAVSKFEIRSGDSYAEVEIGWQGEAEGDGYNYEIDDAITYQSYYFLIEFSDGEWTIEFHQ